MKIYGPYLYKSSSKWRRLVNIVDDDGQKRSQSYARFLLEQHLGRPLADNEDADHIDGDTLNDDLSNLRPLLLNLNRGRDNPAVEMYEFDCPVCQTHTAKPARQVRFNRTKAKAGPFCGRKCARAYQAAEQSPTSRPLVTEDDQPKCKKGHVKTGSQTLADGRVYSVCNVCKAARKRERIERARVAQR